MGDIFLYEIMGTGLLTLLGCGVVANVVLPKTKGNNGGWLLINFGWGLAVFAGVYAAYKTGAHLNPAVTFGIMASGAEFYDGANAAIPVNFANTVGYLAAEMIGAFLGAVIMWVAYKQHFDQDAEPATKLAVFSTGAEIRNPMWNTLTEIVGTFVLVFVILMFGATPSGLGPLAVALLVVGIGNSLGGPTGYAINPARDLGPRIAHAVLPIRGKGGSDWGYSWIPVVGPIIGGVIAGLVYMGLYA
ncbi:aquaporin family protein [Ornithinimicrobium sp. F0845]|uniref:MIP/aquaporin family protein n=1 Tax=Ornithinimicrobium sp. F0845 TaxID=2926412 RepID=UPI001FF5DE91|nr:MIP/aquaporin family protein [Ornithinimicrobium sp. F0845]MCK0111263.1 aquaporin family protein [Ornithinimicrobium sp. F0845]